MEVEKNAVTMVKKGEQTRWTMHEYLSYNICIQNTSSTHCI